MRPIATDTSDFPKLREKGGIYVDKTAFVHRMVSCEGTSLYFISRPRRFGKSLTLSVFAIHVQERLEEAGFSYDKSLPPPENFGNAIESLSAANGGKGVVILIDEYDAPVQRARGHRGEAQEGHIHLLAQGGRGVQADTREGLRRAVPRRRSPDLAGRTLLRRQDPPPRRLRRQAAVVLTNNPLKSAS